MYVCKQSRRSRHLTLLLRLLTWEPCVLSAGWVYCLSGIESVLRDGSWVKDGRGRAWFSRSGACPSYARPRQKFARRA